MLMIIGFLLLGFGIAFLFNAATVWVIVTLLRAVGITMIGTWTVAFSWPLVLLFTIAIMVIRGIFSVKITMEK